MPIHPLWLPAAHVSVVATGTQRYFGKSLLCPTMRCLYEGRRDLFSGLALEPEWDWRQEGTGRRAAGGEGRRGQTLDDRTLDDRLDQPMGSLLAD